MQISRQTQKFRSGPNLRVQREVMFAVLEVDSRNRRVMANLLCDIFAVRFVWVIPIAQELLPEQGVVRLLTLLKNKEN